MARVAFSVVPYVCVGLAVLGIITGIPALTSLPLAFLLGWICRMYLPLIWVVPVILLGSVIITQLVK